MRDDIPGIGCLLILILYACGLVYTCNREEKMKDEDKLRKELVADSIAKRKQYVSDSIDSVKKTPEYIAHMDSVNAELQRELDEKDKTIIVLVLPGDSTYHYMTQCFEMAVVGKIRLTSRYLAKKIGLKECNYCHYDDEEYVYQDEVLEYVCYHYDKSEIIDIFDIDKYDFEEY